MRTTVMFVKEVDGELVLERVIEHDTCVAKWEARDAAGNHLRDDSCDKISTHWVYGGCRHEHVNPKPAGLCDEHFGIYMDLPPQDQMTCGPCYNGPEPHQCGVGFKEVPSPYEGAVTDP